MFSYSIGAVYLLLFDITFGSLTEAFWVWWKVRKSFSSGPFGTMFFDLQYPIKSYVLTVLFSFAGYLGVNCVLDLVRHFGALIAVTGS